MGIGDSLVASARTKLAEASNSATSKFKVKSTSKPQKADAVNADPNDLVQNEDVFLTEGFARHPKINKSKSDSADYYRFGSTQPATDGLGNPVGDAQAIQPKRMDEFSEGDGRGQDSLASIRLLGPVNDKTKERQDLIPKYTKFMLENVQESHTERSQVVETFGEFFAFFYGERPPIYNFSGILINSKQNNWLADFMFYYENFLRGTKCVEQNATIVLTYGGRQIEGFILSTSNSTAAVTDKGVALTFQVLVIDRKILSLSADFGLVITDGVFAQDEGFLKTLTDSGLSRAEVSSAYNVVKLALGQEIGATEGNKLPASSAQSVLDEFKNQLSGVGPSLTGGLTLIG